MEQAQPLVPELAEAHPLATMLEQKQYVLEVLQIFPHVKREVRKSWISG